ncbi:MAG TPA: maltose alpha-D-glucosyltransferase [Burkholderiales bacterium]|nr:maltose alpha-D-glucosyltransferase [Burkholderiales bacterium]
MSSVLSEDKQLAQAAEAASLEAAAADKSESSTDRALWYKDAVVYQLHVKAFFDSNGDGVGDFKGLTSKLDYIQELGVNVVWLLPFYPSPLKDDGYDIADYRNVHPQYGTREDFKSFLDEAHRRGLRVITELVVNHTSDQHPWFQAARRAPAGSKKRGYYVWSDSEQKYKGTRIIFTDTETSNWAFDPVAKQYYWHRFFSHQPDLNFDNPRVLRAVLKIMQFWANLGVDGFRLDAIPYLCEREGTNNENLPETHEVLKKIRAAIDARYRGRMLLAEANQWPEDVRPYFGDGDECHMAFHFPLMPRMYMAIAQEDRHPVVEIMQQTPDIPDICQWAIFLRNHDELTLEMVTSRERDYMYRMYAADRQARINLGIRRRLAPLMENDPERIKLMNSLLLSMPGAPILYYGDEIGMGDNIYLGDRNGVRTPMQWSPDRNAGFSRADPQRVYLPPIMDPIYGYEAVNVEAQSRDPASLLNWTKRMLATRKSSRAFGRGSLSFLTPGNRKVLAYIRELGEEAILCVANLSRTAQPVELDLKKYAGRVPVEMLGRTSFPPIGERFYLLTLPAYAFYWFRLATDATPPEWHAQVTPPQEKPMLVLFDGWTSFFRDKVVPWRMKMAEKLRVELETQVVPPFLEAQRWYAQKGEPVGRAVLRDYTVWSLGAMSWMLATVEVRECTYFLPLALAWEDEEDQVKALSVATIARIRQQANVGVLADAVADEAFWRQVVKAIGEERRLATNEGAAIQFTPTRIFADLARDEIATLQLGRLHAQSTNTSVRLGERLFLKCFRRVRPGTHPELEVGRYLTEVARFPNCVPLAGSVEYVPKEGEASALALLQAYVPNQGDGWSYTLSYLGRHVETQRGVDDGHEAYITLVQTLATRTAQLHRAFALRSGLPAFEPEPFTVEDFEAWRARVRQEAEQTLALMAQSEKARPFTAQRERLFAVIDACSPPRAPTLKTRHHGDYHLGQVLLANNDFLIIDFEGEPSRPLAESRRKHSPLRDVAGMLRSFSYARGAIEKGERPPGSDKLEAALAAWEAHSRRAFLEAYGAAIAGSGICDNLLDARGLLALAELEKVLYELRYELANRPDWVDIPLRGLAGLLGETGQKHAEGG